MQPELAGDLHKVLHTALEARPALLAPALHTAMVCCSAVSGSLQDSDSLRISKLQAEGPRSRVLHSMQGIDARTEGICHSFQINRLKVK